MQIFATQLSLSNSWWPWSMGWSTVAPTCIEVCWVILGARDGFLRSQEWLQKPRCCHIWWWRCRAAGILTVLIFLKDVLRYLKNSFTDITFVLISAILMNRWVIEWLHSSSLHTRLPNARASLPILPAKAKSIEEAEAKQRPGFSWLSSNFESTRSKNYCKGMCRLEKICKDWTTWNKSWNMLEDTSRWDVSLDLKGLFIPLLARRNLCLYNCRVGWKSDFIR